MKRKSIEELLDNLHITSKKRKKKIDDEKLYTQSEVDDLLQSQQDFLFHKFEEYVGTIRSNAVAIIPHYVS